jgi:hypothetical protein
MQYFFQLYFYVLQKYNKHSQEENNYFYMCRFYCELNYEKMKKQQYMFNQEK